MIDITEAQAKARLLAAIGDPVRMAIIQQLARQSLNVGAISARIGVSMVNVSHHLSVLLDAGFVENQKAGRRVFYHLREDIYQASPELDVLGTLKLGNWTISVVEPAA